MQAAIAHLLTFRADLLVNYIGGCADFSPGIWFSCEGTRLSLRGDDRAGTEEPKPAQVIYFSCATRA